MEIEKEIRYSISQEQKNSILKNTTPYKERLEMLDIACGYSGFDSYDKYKFICRIRQKGDKETLEVKKYISDEECLEQSIKLDKVSDGVNFLNLIGMKPYLYLKRFREVRIFKDLKIFIDEFDIIGDYVEIEYQDSENVDEELNEFINLIGIRGETQDMYGDIVKKKLKKDIDFKELFDEKLKQILLNK